METKDNNSGERSRKIIEKARELADKTEELLEDAAEKLKNSETLKKAGSYIENKIEELDKGELKDKLKSFADKMEVKAGDLLDKAMVHGKKFADKAEEMADDLSESLKGKSKKSGEDKSSAS